MAEDLPPFRQMYSVARTDGAYAMQKSVIEHLEKRNKAVEMMGWNEGQKYLDETQPPQKGLHINGILLSPDHNHQKFDPEVFDLAYTPSNGGNIPLGGFYESIMMPNKGPGRHSDAQYSYGTGNLHDGIITELYPDAPVLHIRSQKDWDDLYNRFKPYRLRNNDKYIPIQNLLRDYDAIQFDMGPNGEHMEWGSESEKELADLYRERGLDKDRRFGTESDGYSNPSFTDLNHRFILNPYSVMSSYPYSRKGDIRHQSPRTENYAPYDRKKALEKLGQRYRDAGIDYDWDPYDPSSDSPSSES